MITREFEQQWEQSTSVINHMTECDVLIDFNEYLKNMWFNVKKIKESYASSFNAFSSNKIDFYADKLLKRINQFKQICLKKDSSGEYEYFTYSYDVIKDEIYQRDGNKIKLKDKYYKVLSKIAESVFKIEDDIYKFVEKSWKDALSNINDYSPDGKYCLLAHADFKTYSKDEITSELKKYNDAQQGLCFSLITDKKTRIFDQSTNYYNYYSHKNGLVGIIAKPKNNSMLGMSDDDMLSTEYIDGKCALNRHFNHSKVNRCYKNGSSEIYCRGTKIMMPNEIFGISVDTINEIILDSNNIEIEAVFYVKNRNGEIPERLNQYKKEQEKICGHKLNIIELKPRNTLKQYNLEEIMANS